MTVRLVAWLGGALLACAGDASPGAPTGFVRVDHPDGSLAGLEFWTEGKKTGPCWYWRADGSLERILFRVDIQVEGPRLEFHPNGMIHSTSYWTHTNPDGPYHSWSEDGQPTYETTYRRGVHDGLERHYWPGGRRLKEEHYVDGVRHGPVLAWSESGVLTLVGHYVDGRPAGTWSHFFDDSGEVRKVEQYRDGKVWQRLARCGPEDPMVDLVADGVRSSAKLGCPNL